MVNWKLSDEGYKLFRKCLEDQKLSSLDKKALASLLKTDRSIIANLLNGSHEGHKSKLEDIMIRLGLDEDEVESDSFAETYFQEVKDSPKSLTEERLNSTEERLNSIDEQIKIQKVEQIAVENPFQPLNGRINKSEQFFNREKELRDIFELLNAGSGVELVGDRKMGKSSLLKQIEKIAATELKDKREVIYFNLQEVRTEEEFYEALGEKLGVQLNMDYRFMRIMKDKRILLLLDKIEKMILDNGFTQHIGNQLHSLAEESSLRLVVASRTPINLIAGDIARTSPFQGIFQRVELKPWQETIVQNFVKTRLEATEIYFSEIEIRKLWQESLGHPQKLMQACFDLYRQKFKVYD